MTTDADDLHRQFLVQSAMSAIEAIDDIIAAKIHPRLSETTKGHIGRILEAGFHRVMDGKGIGDFDQVTAQAIWGVIDLAVYGEEEADLQDDEVAGLESEIKLEVLRAFVNFSEGFMNMVNDEMRRRTGR